MTIKELYETRIVRMDIKEQIDALTESDAKAALKYTFMELQKTMVCPKCKIRVECERENELCESVLWKTLQGRIKNKNAR